MAGDSHVTRAASTGGANVYDEDIGSSILLSGSKWRTGAVGVDGGPVTTVNPFPLRLPPTVTSIITSIAQPGLLLFTGAGLILGGSMYNNFGGLLYLMVFDATSTQADGTFPLQTIQLTNNAATPLVYGHPFYGCQCATGGWLQVSSISTTMSTVDANTSMVGHVTHSP